VRASPDNAAATTASFRFSLAIKTIFHGVARKGNAAALRRTTSRACAGTSRDNASSILLIMRVDDLCTLPYSDAWAAQEAAHAEVLDGGAERILLVEHPPVITFGRRPGVERNLVASDAQLATMGVEVVQSDRGGDITFHGPGQVVAYPIIRLNDHGLSVGGYVRALERAAIETCGAFGVEARREDGAVGVWVDDPKTGVAAKVCAIGVRIRRGVSLHGIALNVSTDLTYFNLIVPCGLAGRRATSVAEVLGEDAPSLDHVKRVLAGALSAAVTERPAERPGATGLRTER
jgi:lipoyl(octanoyl) transferase